MNQVYFYTIGHYESAPWEETRLNPFMNQVYFYEELER